METIPYGVAHQINPKVRKLDRYKRQAEQLVASNVCFCDELMDDADILNVLRSSPAGQARGEAGKRTRVLIWYDQQDAGEATAQPHLRTPPLRAKSGHLHRFLRLVMARTETPDDVDDGDVYVVNDAGRPGNKSEILKAFQTSTGQVVFGSKSGEVLNTEGL